MSQFTLQSGSFYCEDVSLADIAAKYGTPTYVYSATSIDAAFQEYQTALHGRPHLICYAVKANSNLAILNRLAGLGAGFDVVSGGELERVIRAGGDAGRVLPARPRERFAPAALRAPRVRPAPAHVTAERVQVEAGETCVRLQYRPVGASAGKRPARFGRPFTGCVSV